MAVKWPICGPLDVTTIETKPMFIAFDLKLSWLIIEFLAQNMIQNIRTFKKHSSFDRLYPVYNSNELIINMDSIIIKIYQQQKGL